MNQVIPFVPRELSTYESSREMVLSMRDAIQAHKSYYEAGVLHANINPNHIMTLDLEIPIDGEVTKGILLDLDYGTR